MKKFAGPAGLAGRLYLAAMLVCAVCAVRVQVGLLDARAFTGAAYAQEQQSVINDIEIMAGARGLILTVTGSGPISLGGKAAELEKATAKYAEIRVKISRARPALGVSGSFNPPEALPVKEVTVKESPDGVELTVKMRGTANGPVQVRGSGNQVRILMTKDPQPEMVWSSSKVVKGQTAGSEPQAASAPQAAPARPDVIIPSEAERTLGNIRVVERDNSAALYFDLSGPPAAVLGRGGDSLVVVFSNTVMTPKLSTRAYNISGSSAFGSVRVAHGTGADQKRSVTAVVKLKQQGGSPVTAAEDNRYVVRITGGSQGKVFLWSVFEGVQSSETFADIKPEPVDMKKMEARAARDTQPFAGDPMFSVKEGPQAQKQAAPAAQPQAQPAAQKVIPSKPEVPAALPDAPGETYHDSEPAKPAQREGLVHYKVYGRDPFIPLVKDPNLDSEMPRVENLRLVGVLEDSRERIALLEDFTNNNRAYALRVNDPVEYGKVLRVHRDKVVFLIRDFDVSRSYTLSLSRDAEQSGKARKR